jgi:hypothetical protein
VDIAMLNHHVNAINDPNYEIPKGIKNWPAHGDVSKGQAANLAPFIDVDNDGVYSPELGDYPSIPGTRCLLNITHQYPDVQWISRFKNRNSQLFIHF